MAVLYVDMIQHSLDPSDDRLSSFRAAERCQSLLSRMTTTDNFAKRYGIVLDELRAGAKRQLYESSKDVQGTCHLRDGVPDVHPVVNDAYFTPSSDNMQSQLNTDVSAHLPSDRLITMRNKFPYSDDAITSSENCESAGEMPRDGDQATVLTGLSGWGELDSMVSQIVISSLTHPPDAG